MAKSKKTKENNNENMQEVLNDNQDVLETTALEDATIASLFNENKINNDSGNIDKLNISEIINYYEACRIICTQYEKEINLNEIEKRNYSTETIKYNRERFQRFSQIHKRLREIIENKLESLTGYEGW